MGISMNDEIVKKKSVDLHQKIDLYHDMGISMNGDIVKKSVDLHQKIEPYHDMGTSVDGDVVKNPLTCIRKLTRITIRVYPCMVTK